MLILLFQYFPLFSVVVQGILKLSLLIILFQPVQQCDSCKRVSLLGKLKNPLMARNLYVYLIENLSLSDSRPQIPKDFMITPVECFPGLYYIPHNVGVSKYIHQVKTSLFKAKLFSNLISTFFFTLEKTLGNTSKKVFDKF